MRAEPMKIHPSKRTSTFDEVNCGLSESEAEREAKRCLNCKDAPCTKGCPAEIDIPAFISMIAKKEFSLAAQKIKETNSIPGICGRVCPQEKLCEAMCTLGKTGEPIAIGALERFAADHAENITIPVLKKKDRSVAVVGSGPAGLTVAGDLIRKGYSVSLFEALHEPGGVLMYGIPNFRLPKDIVRNEIDSIKQMGVELKRNHVIGKVISLEELQDTYDAVFIGVGAGLPKFMGIPGEDLNGVYTANEYLTRCNLMNAFTFPNSHTPMKKHKKTIVVGGGNVAIDAARVARRIGSQVTVLYRRSLLEMPARQEEIGNAQEEGIEFLMMTNVVNILGDCDVEGVENIQMMLGEEDSSGRRSPIPIEGSEFIVDCDSVIVAIGQTPNPILTSTINLRKYSNGAIMTDDKMRTSMRGVFAGGDIVSGDATVIKAIGDAKIAAQTIHEFLSG